MGETRLAALVHQRGMTGAGIGRELGVRRQTVHNWLSGRNLPRKKLRPLADLLGLTLDELIDLAQTPTDAAGQLAVVRSIMGTPGTVTPEYVDTSRQMEDSARDGRTLVPTGGDVGDGEMGDWLDRPASRGDVAQLRKDLEALQQRVAVLEAKQPPRGGEGDGEAEGG